jgi:hypothetical protein
MSEDEILQELEEKAVCTLGNYRAIADKKRQGGYR